MLPVTTVFTLRPVLLVTLPPGPVAASGEFVVACGETAAVPLGAPAVTPLSIEVSTTSAVAQLRLLVWPQLIFGLSEVNLPILDGATTTCAEAIPAVKRGSGAFLVSSSPRFHGPLVTVPFLVT